ncbi:hypothetical protein [Nocardia nova]|uniref:hypothetical protein n=1 Tax=Nocardia nova TaxID=37330 RepID=UPI00273863B0|nr:hypothetical protein [Nocardia nova]
MTDLTPEHLTAGSPQSLAGIVDCIKHTGGAVEVQGVRIEPLDEDGETATTRNVTGLMESLSQMESRLLEAHRWASWFAAEKEHWLDRAAMTGQRLGRRIAELEASMWTASDWAAWFAAERDEAREQANQYLSRLDRAAQKLMDRRSRINGLELDIDHARAEAGLAVGEAGALRARVMELQSQVAARDARIAELEAAQPETVGYVVAARRDDGEFFGATIWTGQAQAESMAVTASAYHRESFRVFELQEVRDDA